jgi:hypothetical protein
MLGCGTIFDKPASLIEGKNQVRKHLRLSDAINRETD